MLAEVNTPVAVEVQHLCHVEARSCMPALYTMHSAMFAACLASSNPNARCNVHDVAWRWVGVGTTGMFARCLWVSVLGPALTALFLNYAF